MWGGPASVGSTRGQVDLGYLEGWVSKLWEAGPVLHSPWPRNGETETGKQKPNKPFPTPSWSESMLYHGKEKPTRANINMHLEFPLVLACITRNELPPPIVFIYRQHCECNLKCPVEAGLLCGCNVTLCLPPVTPLGRLY